MAVKTRELSWSLSRARMFEECPRRYYLHSYLAKWGYAADAPEQARLAWEMKNLKGLDMWAGEVVHGVIQWALERARDGGVPSADEVRAEARRRLSSGWQASQKGLWRAEPKEDHPSIFEHYYRIPVQKAATDRIMEKTFTSLANFMESDILRYIAAAPVPSWLPIERYAAFRLDGLLFYLKFDFALRDGKWIRIYDWKTGKPTADEGVQLACYALYASDRWELPLDGILVSAVHLHPELEAPERLVSEDDLAGMKTFVRGSFDAMLKCLRNPARDIAVLEDFPMTGNLLRCNRCNFRGVCEQGRQTGIEPEDIPEFE